MSKKPAKHAERREPSAIYRRKGEGVVAFWRRAKASTPDAMVGVVVGDFIEFICEEAETVAAALSIVLVRRHEEDAEVALCFVPFGWQGELRLEKLRAAGHRVVVVGDDPRQARHRGSDALPLERHELEALSAGAHVWEPV